LHVSHIPGRGLKNLALGWHGKNNHYKYECKIASRGLLRKEFIMGTFRVVERNSDDEKTIHTKIHSTYDEAIIEKGKLETEKVIENRQKPLRLMEYTEYWVEGKIDGEWYALA